MKDNKRIDDLEKRIIALGNQFQKQLENTSKPITNKSISYFSNVPILIV
jgi:hypothetical protein